MGRELIAGLAKGLAILELFSEGIERLSVSEAARLTDLSPASARRCLRTLAVSGYVAFDGKYYSPTPRIMRLSNAYLASSELAILAKPHVSSARDRLHESVSISVRDSSDVVFIARAEVQRIVSAGVQVGTRLPLLVSASGHVHVADLPTEEVDALWHEFVERKTAGVGTLLSRSALHGRLRRVREEGYGYTDDELETGMRTLAVPIRNAQGTLRAAMAVSVFSSRISMEQLVEEFRPVLVAESTLLGNAL